MSAALPAPTARSLARVPFGIEDAMGAAADYLEAATAAHTRRTYGTAWSAFVAWCDANGIVASPASPSTVGAYIAGLAAAGRSLATVQHAKAAVAWRHRIGGQPIDMRAREIAETMKGIRRRLGSVQRTATALLPGALRRVLDAMPDTLQGRRDRALLLVGFHGARRRSEIVGLDLGPAQSDDASGWIEHSDEGATIVLRASKTNKGTDAERYPLKHAPNADACPIRALRGWVVAAGISAGPIFRSIDRHGNVAPQRLTDRAVALIVKRAVERAGLDPAGFSGHSLRAGFATSAAMLGAAERDIFAITGHKSVEVGRRYIRRAELHRNKAADAVLAAV